MQGFWKIVLVVLPAVVSGVFSYEVAVVEARAKVTESSSQANAGYQTLVAAVEKLQGQVETLSLANAKLEGYVDGLKSTMPRAATPETPALAPPAFKKFSLPKDLGRAWNQRTVPLDSKAAE